MSTGQEESEMLDLENILAMQESDFEIVHENGKLMGAKGALEAGRAAKARLLMNQVKDLHRQIEEQERNLVTLYVEGVSHDREYSEIDNNHHLLEILLANFNEAYSIVPASVREKVTMREKVTPPQPIKGHHEEEQVKFEQDYPTLGQTTTTTLSQKVQGWGNEEMMKEESPKPKQQKKKTQKRVNFQGKINHDGGATNKRTCNYDSTLPEHVSSEIFEYLNEGKDLREIFDYYRYDEDFSLCWNAMNEMQHRWQRENHMKSRFEAGPTTSCWYRHPQFRGCMDKVWCAEC